MWSAGAAAPSSSSPHQSTTQTNPHPTYINQSQHGPPQPGQSAARPQQSGQPGARLADSSRARPDGDTVHLDRTPTDDEINWLWQKVRTCLSSSRSNASHSSSTITSPATNHNITNHCNPPDPSSCSPGTSRTGNSTESSSNRTPMVSRTYIDGTALAAGPATGGRRPSTSSPYINNYMGSAMPARRRLVTMDTLGRLVQRRLPRRPLSGVTVGQSPAIAGQNARVTSAPASTNRTSSSGE